VRARGTIVTALAELALGAVLWVVWFAQYRLEFYAAPPPVGASFGYGAVMFLSFLITLRGLVAGFLVAEGAARLLHAVFTHEPIGWLVPFLWRAAARRLRARRRARVVDRVVRHGDGTVTVEGLARDWTPLATFLVGDRHYTLADVQPVGPELMRYTLRPASEQHLIRNVVRVDA
jgi:hypothetical protein